MTFKEIAKVLNEIRARRVLLLTHHNSDPDAIGSAFAFQTLLNKTMPRLCVEIGVQTGVSYVAKQMFDYIPIKLNTKPEVEKAHVLILLDTNTIQQLDELAEEVAKSSAPLIVIDHHVVHPEMTKTAKLCVIDDTATSTCEIVYTLFKEAKIKPDIDSARALFLGIAFDSRHFALGNSSTFKTVAELVEVGVKPQEALMKLTLPMCFSERIARLKACKRAKTEKIGDWIIALSHVSAYQASAARALIDLGAHVAAVAGKKNDTGEIEISMRCTRDFSQRTSIHLGKDIAKPLGQYLQGNYLQGMGGGHAMAAGVNGKGDIDATLKECLKLLKERLSNQE